MRKIRILQLLLMADKQKEELVEKPLYRELVSFGPGAAVAVDPADAGLRLGMKGNRLGEESSEGSASFHQGCEKAVGTEVVSLRS